MILVNVLCVLCFKYWKSAFVFIILSTVLYSVFSFSDVVVLISNWFELKILAILEWFGAVRMVNEFSFSLPTPTSNPKNSFKYYKNSWKKQISKWRLHLHVIHHKLWSNKLGYSLFPCMKKVKMEWKMCKLKSSPSLWSITALNFFITRTTN